MWKSAWIGALLIAFSRGKLESVKGSQIYQQYAAMAEGV